MEVTQEGTVDVGPAAAEGAQASGHRKACQNVSAVATQFDELLKSWDEVAASQQPPAGRNIEVEDMISKSPYERIADAIERHRVNPNPNVRMEMPKYQDLLDEPRRSGLALFRNEMPAKRLKAASASVPPSQMEKDHDGFLQVEPREMVLTLSLVPSHKKAARAKTQTQFMVLGSQPLTELRDRMYCLADYILDGPTTRSSFMFIENTFYNDMRSEHAIDYSRTIMLWANENERWRDPGVGMGMTAVKMEGVKFRDLSIRLGEPYLLCHQGDCEHILVFESMHLITPQDNQNALAYPLQVLQKSVFARKCSICNIYGAKKVTHGDQLAPSSPCFFCDVCYEHMHYVVGKDGTAVLLYDDFEVYPYFHE